MLRRLSRIATIVSAVLFVLLLAATVISFWRAPLWEHQSSQTIQSEVAGSWDRIYEVRSCRFARGGFGYIHYRVPVDGLPHQADGSPEAFSRLEWDTDTRYPYTRSEGGHLGFRWSTSGPFLENLAFTIPTWPVLVVMGVMPLVWCASQLRARQRTVRSRRGLCAACGYDLRASRERCPECGMAKATPVSR